MLTAGASHLAMITPELKSPKKSKVWAFVFLRLCFVACGLQSGTKVL